MNSKLKIEYAIILETHENDSVRRSKITFENMLDFECHAHMLDRLISEGQHITYRLETNHKIGFTTFRFVIENFSQNEKEL